MSTATKDRKPRQVSRSIRLGLAPFGGNPGIVTITVQTGSRVPKVETTDYFLRRLPSDFGAAFSLEKFATESDGEPETYHVNLCGEKSSCECKGHLRWGHCKHVSGLEALVKAGKV
jgi:hypothetical protein